MTDYPGAVWFPNKNFFPDTGKKSFLILHGTAGGSSAQEIAQYFRGTEGSNNPVSPHYIVDQAGMIVQCVAEKDGAYAQGIVNNPNWQGNPNDYCISIEHVKPDDANVTALTPAQQAASFALIKDICQRNGIGMHDADDTTGITGHFAIDSVNRARCPGTYPWQELWNYLGVDAMLVNYGPQSADFNQYFTAIDTNRWQCKETGRIVQFDILKFFETLSRDGKTLPVIGLPISNEIYQPYKNTMVVTQFFERAVCVYNPSHSFDSQPGTEATFLAKYDDPFIASIDPARKKVITNG